jgi:hypothetical protein
MEVDMRKQMIGQITLPCTAGSRKGPREHNRTSTFLILSHFDLKVWYVEADVAHKVVKIAGAVITVLPLTLQI